MGILQTGGLPGSEMLVEFQKRFFLAFDTAVAVQRGLDEAVVRMVIHTLEGFKQLFVSGKAYSPEKCGHRYLPFAVHLDRYNVFVAGLELKPGAAVGNKLRHGQDAPGGGILLRSEVDARRAHQLAHHNALRTIDDKGAVGSHYWDVAQEELLLLFLISVLHRQPGSDVHGSGVGNLSLAAFLLRVLWILELVVDKVELEASPGKVLNRGNFSEQLP